jgi:hypothetical protein
MVSAHKDKRLTKKFRKNFLKIISEVRSWKSWQDLGHADVATVKPRLHEQILFDQMHLIKS